MHLSQLAIDLRSHGARRDLADAYEMHRTLSRAFAVDAATEPERFLWRIEAAGVWAEPMVLVQSRAEPDWSPLTALANYLRQSVHVKRLDLDRLVVPARKYRFRFVANPTVTRNGKRYGLAAEAQQLEWLGRQGDKHGFSVEAVMVAASDRVQMRKKDAGIHLQRTCFEGLLTVRDANAVSAALLQGIGPGKAFGCGMLSIAPG
ncbi:type I-E CRISPR-associated protein Cas6/Cse3/CasE [Bordetella genomosp. 13]|uniref:Type I-E CRISPR-associated protein Cas6/Cse3/CasE n=1 Tax=Bordetella genomosp. 13 TaxID=463040 RepID=A0A1W6ZHV5_9BORD|nr:type I-E CRISPR-associated protein Cas6/Cse3/CasE [Bordetella genomosp. 13]ARP96730.1 type I-E CRISPR-associated protein Cas6/Cse3/CasE [Bordetella genomosp. 13]